MTTQLIKYGENQCMEFKTSFQKEVISSVVAFANAKGGKILIGVSDGGDILGTDVNKESLQDWINQIKLYDDLTIQKVQSGDYSSKTRNRAIARAFKEAGIIERYGSGIARIKNECKNHGVAEPTFEEFVHGFRVILFKEKIKTTQETKKLLTKDKILLELKKDATLTREELAKKIWVSANAIKQHLSKLKDAKKIKRAGSTKSGHWEVLLDS